MMKLQEYIDWYTGHYGHKPSAKLIEAFIALYGEEVYPPKKVDMLFGGESEG